MAHKECIPLKTLEDVDDWENILTIHENVLRFQSKLEKNNNRSKRLLCHDMAGGYLNDRFVDGCSEPDSYRFYHWSQIDMFIYFSHNFITIPPVCWINASHLHGVPVLGTLITEWDDGAKICEKFLKDAETYTKLADKLVEIAVALNFDGWLVNIENPIKTELVENLVDFVKILHEKMQAVMEHSNVIWYDSVTKEGKLKWQNELNGSNRCFFDVCDGIFVNYTWKEENLATCVKEAKSRLHDVYIGVDVFGRNFYGGGGYSTDLAMAEISKKDLSSAIFAPGWVHEVCGSKDFTQNENRFWDLLSPYCHYNSIIKLPLTSSLCQGFGKKKFQKGKVVHSEPWFNLSLQNIQPTIGCGENDTVSIFTNDAYNGGSSRKYTKNGIELNQPNYFSLFKFNLIHERNLCITYATKDLKQNETAINIRINLLGCDSIEQKKLDNACSKINSSFIENGWHVRQLEFHAEEFDKFTITEIGLEITAKENEFSILLGHIEIF